MWGTLVREAKIKPPTLADFADPDPKDDGRGARMSIREDWDFALGGGATPGMVVLVYGPAGVGKTADLLRLAADHNAAYVSTEREPLDLFSTAQAMGVNARRIFPAKVQTIAQACAHIVRIGSAFSVLDSWNELSRVDPDYIGKLRDAIGDGCIFIICHVTQEGRVRGPETLIHKVDAVIKMRQKHLYTSKNWHGPRAILVRRNVPTFSRRKERSPEPTESVQALRLVAPLPIAPARAAKPKTPRTRGR